MNSKITYWQNVILSNKKIEPKNDEQMAIYKIAEYLIFWEKERKAAQVESNRENYEHFLELPETVTVFKFRENGNYSFPKKKWLGNKITTKII